MFVRDRGASQCVVSYSCLSLGLNATPHVVMIVEKDWFNYVLGFCPSALLEAE